MKVPARFQLGVATHTGIARSTNEDDYLLFLPPRAAPFQLVAAVADGMGGVTGGGEASRTGLRGFAGGLLAAGAGGAPEAAVAAGFAAACERVHQQSRQVPALRDMGTTLTVIAFLQDRAVVGHVGDSRVYRLRGGGLEPLTTDHAVREQQSRLLRCIGGGQAAETPDVEVVEVAAGDRFLLCSDGIWSPVPAAHIAETLGGLAAQAAAERLVQLANAAGGPDNATAVVVHVAAAAPGAAATDVELPREESSRAAELTVRALGRRRRRWPWWLLLLAGIAVLAAVALEWLAGIDAWAWLRSLA